MSFDFKLFSIHDERCAMKVGTDGVLIGAWAELPEGPDAHVADLGAGSGIVSLMIAQRYALAQVTAVEIDPEAAADCEDNFRRSPFADRLTTVCTGAEEFRPEKAPNLIVSNPPYFTNGVLSPSATRRRARHESTFGPLAAIEIASQELAPAGGLAMITPTDGESDLLFLAEMHRLHLRRLCRVHTVENRPATRLLWQFSRTAGEQVTSDLAIRTSAGSYTDAYIALTRDFYLKM